VTANLPASVVQRHAPFPRLDRRRVLNLDPAKVLPVIRIAHRLRGGLRVTERIIVDHELVHIREGFGRMHIGDEAFDFASGDVLLIPPFVLHGFDGSSGEATEHVAVHFDLSPDTPREPLAERKPYEVRLTGIGTLPRRLRMPRGHRVSDLLLDLVRSHGSAAPEAIFDARGCLMRVVAELLHQARGPASDDLIGTGLEVRARARVDAALALLEKRINAPLTVYDLAGAAGLSEPHLNRLFRQYTGMSPMAYLRRRRIDRARHLLADATLSVKEIAHLVGFEDSHHFSRAFRQIDGLTPTGFRAAAIGGRSRG